MRIAVLGDVQGWIHPLEDALRAVGADLEAAALPEGTAVVQVGDLVHKGPASSRCLELVDRFLVNGESWVQLVGNHEAGYLPGGRRFWADEVDLHSQMKVGSWMRDGKVRLAVGLDTEELGETLVTHAGLTREKWVSLGGPRSAADAARLLNEEATRDPALALEPGIMLGSPNASVGVVWAEAISEVLRSWRDDSELPFSQVHGHSSTVDWRTGRPNPDVARNVSIVPQVDVRRRHVTFRWPDRHAIVGIDPDFLDKKPSVQLSPLVLTGKILD